MKKTTLYISIDGVDPSWIVGIIARDLQKNINNFGYVCRVGSPEEYEGEDICHHMGYAYAVPFPEAKVNTVFVTHIDDCMKERELLSLKDKFDMFIAMSNQDRDYLLDLGFPKQKVISALLPVRKPYVKPVSVGIFSACYSDGRKNENWLLEFNDTRDASGLINYVFLGPRWGMVVEAMEASNCSFEWHCASTDMQYEYEFQRSKLHDLDYYIYLGFDGGAMGSLDAYGHGRRLILVDDSYHQDIPDVEFRIEGKEHFFSVMDSICQSQMKRLSFFSENTAEVYSKKLLCLWAIIVPELFDKTELDLISVGLQPTDDADRLHVKGETISIRKKRHASLTWHRVLGSLLRSFIRWRK